MSGTIQYTIKPYDTIWMLAQVYNTTVDSIMGLNPGINPRNLYIGQVLTIRPGHRAYPSNQGTPMTPGRGQTMPTPGGTMTQPGNGRTMPMPGGTMTQPGSGGTTPMPGGMMTQPGSGGTMIMPGTSDNSGMDSDGIQRDLDELRDFFRMLWEQHVYWTRMAVMGIVHNLPEAELIQKRLLRNPVDFANTLLPFYGEDAATDFEKLFTDHLTIAAELVKAVKAGDNAAATDANKRWHDNADQIAAFLASVNPYWADDDWSAMLNEHLNLLADNAAQMITGKHEESINGFDDIEMQALEMADVMADGLAMQFSALY